MKVIRKSWWEIGFTVLTLIFLMGLIWEVSSLGRVHQERNASLIRASRSNLVKHRYPEAESELQRSLDMEDDVEARRLVSQIQSYVNGNDELKMYRLNLAMRYYRKTSRLSSSTLLRRRSLGQIHLIRRLASAAVSFNKVYNRAVISNHEKRFRRSAQQLTLILNRSDSRLRYFSTFLASVRELRWSDDHALLSHQVERNYFPGVAGVNAPQINHNVRLSSRDLTAAKREIRLARVNVRRMNKRTILNIIKQADLHHTSVYRYAKNNY